MINGVTTTAPTAGAAATAASKPNGAMGKEEFLKLFVAQMKNQDPLNPMQGEELPACASSCWFRLMSCSTDENWARWAASSSPCIGLSGS